MNSHKNLQLEHRERCGRVPRTSWLPPTDRAVRAGERIWVSRPERVIVVDDGQRLGGVLAGFGDDGQLLLEEGCAVREVWAGSLSLGPA